MKKSIAIGLLVTLLGFGVQAQQRAQYSQYMINQYVLNPAVGGSYDYAHIVAGYRNQWVGQFAGASPVTYYISGHTPIGRGSKKPHPYRNKHAGFHALGGQAYVDQTGPTSRMGALASYTYNERLYGDWRAALGAFVGVQQFSINLKPTDFAEAEDVGTQSTIVPDGSLGLWVYNKHVYFGATMAQLFQSRLNVEVRDSQGDKVNKLANHYFITGGIKLDVAHDWAVIPSIMLKYNHPAPLSMDINTKIRYRDMLWAGVSYRNFDSFTFLCGVLIAKQLEFGYSYDYTVSKIAKVSTNSHEIILGWRLWPRIRLDCPSNFW
jgi:type IX secretion system PorP/SprF family membrane protein